MADEIVQGLDSIEESAAPSAADRAAELAAFNEVVGGKDDGEALHGEPVVDTEHPPVDEPAPKPDAVKPKAKADPVPAKAAAVEPDPWEGVNPKLREVFDSQTRTIGELNNALKRTEGRLGALQSAYDAAKSVSKAAGGGFAINAEAMKEFREQFGDDLADHLGKIFVATTEAKAAAAEQGKAFDADAFFRERVQPSFSTAIADAKTEARELARLDSRHEGWEETIATPEFTSWVFDGGPTQAERDHQASLTGPQLEAAQNALIRKYPIWWAEKGALMDSPKASDAAKLLDAYSKKPVTTQNTAETTQNKRNRLAAAVTPKGTQQPAHEAVSDAEAAQKAFEAQFTDT